MYDYFVSTYGWGFNDHYYKSGRTSNLRQTLGIVKKSHMSNVCEDIVKTFQAGKKTFSKTVESRGGRSTVTVTRVSD